MATVTGIRMGKMGGEPRPCPRCKAVIDRRWLLDDALRERDRREPGYDGELIHERVEHVPLGQSCRGHIRNWHRAGTFELREHLRGQGFDDEHTADIVDWAKRDEERQAEGHLRRLAMKQAEMDRKLEKGFTKGETA